MEEEFAKLIILGPSVREFVSQPFGKHVGGGGRGKILKRVPEKLRAFRALYLNHARQGMETTKRSNQNWFERSILLTEFDAVERGLLIENSLDQ